MVLVCLDIEGVLVPEIWPQVADRLDIPELLITSLDEPDLVGLNRRRIRILQEHGISLKQLCAVVESIEPFEGAPAFMEKLRALTQVVTISDAALPFTQIVLKKLGSPHVFCNSFTLTEDGELKDFEKRIKAKADDVKALQSMGYETVACGDSAFDVSMIKASKDGFLFRSRESVRTQFPEIRHFTAYEDLYEAIREAVLR